MENNLIISSLAEGTPSPVNMSLIVTLEKSENPLILDKNQASYEITFRRIEDTLGPKDIIWKYKSKEDRDSEYDKIICKYVTNITNITTP